MKTNNAQNNAPGEQPKRETPNEPDKNNPLQPDKNPDPTQPSKEGNDPGKVDPTRIIEPFKTDPTRIDEPMPPSAQ